MKYIDLFAGTGAFSYVLDKHGFECVFANDMIEASRQIYTANHKSPFILGDLNDIAVRDIPAHDVLCAGFPCFVSGTMVLTGTGYKPIEEVDLSDTLLTHKGRFQKILNLQSKVYTGRLYHINLKDHPDAIVCTEEHPFYTRTRNGMRFGNPQWKKAKDITGCDYFGMVINRNSVVPERKGGILLDSADMWFSIGYFVGGGAIIEGEIQLSMPQDTDDTRRIVFGDDRTWVDVLSGFGDDLQERTIPEWVHDAPRGCLEEFVNGFLVAHGWKAENEEGLRVSNIPFKVASGLQRVCLKLGRVICLENDGNSAYQIIYSNNTTEEHSAIIDGNYAWFPQEENGIRTEETTRRLVHNFEVEYDNSYIVSNVLAHNCQPFSIAGKREGFNDPRSNVFWKILEIVRHYKPPIVLLENVKNLRTHDEGRTFKTIYGSLTDLGYHVRHNVLDTSKATSVPQHRERIYILAFRDKQTYDKFQLDFEEADTRPISDFLEKNVPSKYYYKDNLKVFPVISASVTKPVRDTNTVYQYRRHYVRENKKNQCPTLTANMGGGGHNVPLILDGEGIRKLTPRECFNLQGFPPDYILPTDLSDTSLYKLAGNAVSVPVVELIITALLGNN